MSGSFLWLFRLNLILEFRDKSGLFYALLYALSTAYIASVIFQIKPGVQVWSGVLWFLVLFNAIAVSANAFRQEASTRYTYYYQLVNPAQLFLSRWLFTSLYCIITALFQFALLSFFIGMPITAALAYLVNLLIGALGFASVLSLTSAIAAITGSKVGLMAILSFPLLVPVLIIGLRGAVLAGLGAEWAALQPYVFGNLSMTALIIAMGYLLFPYLWQD